MKKLLILLTVVGLTTTTTTTVIACGSDVLKIDKIQLDSVLINLKVDSDTTIETVIDDVLKQNSGFDVLEKANLEVETDSFVEPHYGKDGSVVIKVKEGSKKYTGSVEVTINKLDQIALGSVLTNLTVDSDTTIDNVIDVVLSLPENSGFDDSERDHLEVEAGSFHAPTYTNPGSAKIVAKQGTKYTGSITITINAIGQKNLSDLTDIIKEVANTTKKDNALKTFLDVNKNKYPDLVDNLSLKADSFVAPTFTKTGTYVLVPLISDGKYQGAITVTIDPLGQTNLAALDLNLQLTIHQKSSKEAIFEAFLEQNQDILGNDLNLDQVDLSDFQSAQYVQNGQLTISAQSRITNEWTGSIQLKTKYILTDANFEEVFNYVSDNNLFQFKVPVGTIESLYGLVFGFTQDQLTSKMHQFYELDSNIESIEFGDFWFVNPDDGSRPDLDKLQNNVGYTFHSDHFRILISLKHFDGTKVELDMKDIKITWTVVEKTD